MEDDLGAAGPSRGRPHPGAEGGDAGEEDQEAAVRKLVRGVGITERDHARQFGQDFVRERRIGW